MSGTSSRARWLLVFLVLTWAISWPVIKIGVSAAPPLWFACLRYAIAAACLFAATGVRGELAVPPRSDWWLVLVSGGLQMATYSALTGLALTVLPPGRASVLAFSTPIWVVPLAGRWLDEPIARRGQLGVAVGLAGVVAIASPSLRADGGGLGAYALLCAAAAAWAVSIVSVRAHRFSASAFALAPWQALVATLLLAPIALIVDGAPPAIDARTAAALAYVGPVATAFAYWAVVEVGRQVRASTISMALLLTPSLGITISALALGERIGPSLVAGVVMIGAGIRLATARHGGELPCGMESEIEEITDPTRWKKAGWIAQVIKNEDDDGWAVAMTRIGDSEPALVGPWTMGRDKRNPKPLDASAFATLVKTANEVLRRHTQAALERLHKTLSFTTDAGQRVRADLDIAPDDDDPHAVLKVVDDATDEVIRAGRVSQGFKLTATTVQRFVRTGE